MGTETDSHTSVSVVGTCDQPGEAAAAARALRVLTRVDGGAMVGEDERPVRGVASACEEERVETMFCFGRAARTKGGAQNLKEGAAKLKKADAMAGAVGQFVYVLYEARREEWVRSAGVVLVGRDKRRTLLLIVVFVVAIE